MLAVMQTQTAKKNGFIFRNSSTLIGSTHEQTNKQSQFQVTANKMKLFLTYLFLKTLYMFQEGLPPIIRSTQLYKQLQVLSTNTAASCVAYTSTSPYVLIWFTGTTSSYYTLTHWGRLGSFKLFKRPLPGILTILTL